MYTQRKAASCSLKSPQGLASKRTEAQADGPLKRCWRLLGCFLLASYTQQSMSDEGLGCYPRLGSSVSHSRVGCRPPSPLLGLGQASASPRLLTGGDGALPLFLYGRGRQGTSGRRDLGGGFQIGFLGRFSFSREPGRLHARVQPKQFCFLLFMYHFQLKK